MGAIAIAHGSDSTDQPELFLENGFDYVCCGEAEETLVQLCQCVLEGEPLPDIAGVVRRNESGQVVRSAQHRARNPAWPQLPFPERDLVDLEPYRAAWTQAHGYFSMNMVSSRGCPYHCNWCAKPISGQQFQLRPAADVAEEMGVLKRTAGAEHIWFGDDIFALSQDWVREFADEVSKRDASIPFKIQSRANLMTERTVKYLKIAGCAEVWMGVESGSQSVLKAMDKGLNLESVVTACRLLKQAGIRACFFLQLGYPGESWSEIEETIAFVRRTRPDDVGISFSYPLPGTVFYDRVREQLGLKRNWTDSDDLCIMFRAAYKTEFYRAVRDALHAEVSSWSEPEPRSEVRREVEALWRVVDELEPVTREEDATILPDRTEEEFSSDLIPAETLLQARRL
jgi:anaerobic magnesium-protoporphyrin IX monomethyl ester cyclase